MKRHQTDRRADWQSIVEQQGLVYHSTPMPDGTEKAYWSDGIYYSFTLDQILELERVTNELTEMCLAAGQYIIDNNRFADLAIPEWCIQPIKDSWELEPPSIYARFDLRYDGVSPPKMLEFNADTPTSLVESAVIQWNWMEDRFSNLDQWNLIHERLIEVWQDVAPYLNSDVVHFAHTVSEDSGEDLMNAAYMMDCALQAGLRTIGLFVEDIGWNMERKRFVDLDEREISNIFKLYPWEWMANEEYADQIVASWEATGWIEPIWKMLWSNKGLLPILWEMYPNHPNLLASYFALPNELTSYAKKPILGREGANVTIVHDGAVTQSDGIYGEDGYVFQEYCPLPDFNGNFPVLGTWVVGLEAAGMGIRESDGLITDNLSRFCPHVIEN